LRAEDLRSQLDKGIPVVVGVAFKGSGHIVCVIGYDGPTWVVHDPYGTRHGASDRYDVGVGGEADRYSQSLMDKIYWDGGKKSGWGRIVTAIASTPTGMPTGI
jgi:uncharacterized protein YvpB